MVMRCSIQRFDWGADVCIALPVLGAESSMEVLVSGLLTLTTIRSGETQKIVPLPCRSIEPTIHGVLE
jgi:hypothetical protein